jgi:hypothetical protein
MLGRVGPQSPPGLFELPLGPDAVATPGLVPRNGDVDEALEEVALLWVGRPPRVLELLVRPEVLAPADQIEPGGQLIRLRP